MFVLSKTYISYSDHQMDHGGVDDNGANISDMDLNAADDYPIPNEGWLL